MATPAQVKTIHALKSILKMDDADYRVMLESYTGNEGAPVWSSRDLNHAQALSLIQTMEQIIKRTPGLESRRHFHFRGIDRISWKQMQR